MTTSFKLPIKKGNLIVGKWKQGHYRVERLLGEGANGKVFLVSKDWQWYAMKIGQRTVDLQSEINALKALSEFNSSQNSYLKDVDDWITPEGKEIPFYTMRYIKGTNIVSYMQLHGYEWFPLVGLHLLRCLEELHRAGWVFGDLKLENIIVGQYGEVELIDFGGATLIGKGVKQFTEIYDRGYWNCGSRSADAQYDLFSFAILCLHLFAPQKLHQLSKGLLPQNRSAVELMELVTETPQLKPYENWLEKAFKGSFSSSKDAAEQWRMLAHQRKPLMKQKYTPRWLKIIIAVSLISLAASASLYVLDYTGLLN